MEALRSKLLKKQADLGRLAAFFKDKAMPVDRSIQETLQTAAAELQRLDGILASHLLAGTASAEPGLAAEVEACLRAADKELKYANLRKRSTQ